MAVRLRFFVEHPFWLAAGTGAVNGALARAGGRKVNVKTAATLAGIVGLTRVVLTAYQPKDERGPVMSKMPLGEVGFWSVGGFFLGVLPFLQWLPPGYVESDQPLLPNPTQPESTPALSGASGRRAVR